MTAALEGLSGQKHDPAAIYPIERSGTHFTEARWAYGLYGRAENFVFTGIRSQTVEPVA